MNPDRPRVAPLLVFSVLLMAGCATDNALPPRPSAPVEAGVAAEVFSGPVFDITQLDRAPRPTFQAKPRYPFDLRRAGVSGEAIVDFIVDSQGNVRNAYAMRATHPAFAAEAVATVSQWRFQPGMKNGRTVNTHMQVPIVFSIN